VFSVVRVRLGGHVINRLKIHKKVSTPYSEILFSFPQVEGNLGYAWKMVGGNLGYLRDLLDVMV